MNYDDALRGELGRRIEEISNYPDETFGRITNAEWIIFCLVAVVLPLLAVWLAA